ncbi:MAG: hypothetical protein ACP5I3_07270, partial [Thermoproteus sp.]
RPRNNRDICRGRPGLLRDEVRHLQPDDLLATLGNPLLAVARLNYAVVRLDLRHSAVLAARKTGQIPTTADAQAPSLCWWAESSSVQTPQTRIPIAWVYDTSNINGLLGAYTSQTAEVDFSASAGIEDGAGGPSASVEYQFVGVSAQTSALYNTGVDFGPSTTTRGGYIYQLGTIGLAEFELWCLSGDPAAPPIFMNEYAYEAFVDAVAGAPGASTDLSALANALALYRQYTGASLQYVPFDEASISSGTSYYRYYFSYQSYSQPFGLTGAVPIGDLAAELVGVPEGWPAYVLLDLAAGVQVANTQVDVIQLALTSPLTYGDVLVAALPVNYSDSGHLYYPYLLGFNITPPGRYYSPTSIYLDGPGSVYGGCGLSPSDYYYTAYVQIGNTPLLVPGGTVYAYLYGPDGKLVWSGQVTLPSSDYGTVNGVPMHQPAVIDIPSYVFSYSPFGTPYTLYVYYAGYTTPYGTITYSSSSAQITIYAVYRC